MTDLMQFCDVLITTEEDIEKVFGIKGKDYEEVAAQLAQRFPLQVVAITLRENPLVWKNTWTAIAYQDGKVLRTRTYEVEIVDRLGAGDSFAAGLDPRLARRRSAKGARLRRGGQCHQAFAFPAISPGSRAPRSRRCSRAADCASAGESGRSRKGLSCS